MNQNLIAPCGMNCSLCVAYQFGDLDLNKQGFNKKYCAGCVPSKKKCYMKAGCDSLGKGKARFCFECDQFPCQKLKSLDKRYRTKYHMSMIENLESIKKNGIEKFLQDQKSKWTCPECGGLICCHNGLCLNCNLDVLQKNKKYRWNEE